MVFLTFVSRIKGFVMHICNNGFTNFVEIFFSKMRCETRAKEPKFLLSEQIFFTFFYILITVFLVSLPY